MSSSSGRSSHSSSSSKRGNESNHDDDNRGGGDDDGCGFDLKHVVSDEKHYSPFICTICNRLCSLDVLVTPCNHPFCRTCFESWIQDRKADQLTCSCPTCSDNLEVPMSIVGETFVVADVPVRVQPLQTAQPLAYQVLQQVQVSCKFEDHGYDSTTWVGDYADIKEHIMKLHPKSSDIPTATTTTASAAAAGTDAARPLTPTKQQEGTTIDGGQSSASYHDDKEVVDANSTLVRPSTPTKKTEDSTRSVDADDSPRPQKPRSSSSRASPPVSPGGGGMGLLAGGRLTALPPRSKSTDDDPNDNGDQQGQQPQLHALMKMSTRGEPTAAHHARSVMPQHGDELVVPHSPTRAVDDPQLQPDLVKASERCEKLKKQANAKFNRGDVEGARMLYSEGLALISNFPISIDEVRILTASLYSNRAVTFFRERILPPSIEDCDKSLELDPKCEKTYIRKWRALSAMGEYDEATTCLEQGLNEIPESTKLQEELQKAYECPRSPAGQTKMTEFNDMNTIISAPIGFSNSLVPPIHHPSNELEHGGDPSPAAQERADKLKKQANAKFNKGDIDAARSLYTDALTCLLEGTPNGAGTGEENIKTIMTNMSAEIRSLLAMLYSNRAVTFFRDKKFQESLQDCEKAIELDPMTEKSYIRKGRALAALELYDEAYKCLERATQLIPDSKKLAEELEKAQQQRDEADAGIDGDEEVHPLKDGTANEGDKKNKDDTTNEKGDTNKEQGAKTVSGHSSGDFSNSAGSFNFYITPDGEANDPNKQRNESNQPDVPPEKNNYEADLELADKLKRNANAKFNRGDIAGARLLYTEALACLPNDRNHPEIRACLASLYANRAVTFFREKEFGPSTWDCDKAIELDPKSEKSYIRKARALSSLEKFDEAIECLEGGLDLLPNSSRLQEELTKAREQIAELKESTATAKVQSDMNVGSEFLPSNSGHDLSVGSNSNPMLSSTPARGDKPSLVAVSEGSTEAFNLPFGSSDQLERAEKLKKQANAKLNKGDVAGARILYGEGLACLPTSENGPPLTEECRELAASLYANRAVTYFREKKFESTVHDCDKSLELDPKHEKSYVRKWRAHMALGNFEDAHLCLQRAVQELPNSERLTEELKNASEQKELLLSVNNLLNTGEYQEARDTLKPFVKTSDNVSLWLAAARADACLGLTDSALERVNKVLIFNAKHVEGLQVKGYALFLSGEIENGIATLQEARDIDPARDSNTDATTQLEQCNITFNSFSKGQKLLKRGRYKEAVEQFSLSIQDGINLPKESPLYGLLLTERAEANLLCQQYEEALTDCTEAIRIRNDNLTAWTVKVEVYFALGKLQRARDELYEARRTWGAGIETIEDAFKKTDFELRLFKVDEDLHKLVAAVESGSPDGGGPPPPPVPSSSNNKDGDHRDNVRGSSSGGNARKLSMSRILAHQGSPRTAVNHKGLVRKGSKGDLAGSNGPNRDSERGKFRKPRVPPHKLPHHRSSPQNPGGGSSSMGGGGGGNSSSGGPRSYNSGRRKDRRPNNGSSDLIQT